MAASQLQPPPYQSAQGSVQWHEWFRIINDLLDGVAGDIGEIANVTITSVGDNEFFTYDSATSMWINQTFEEVGGIVLDTTPTLGGTLSGNDNFMEDIESVHIGDEAHDITIATTAVETLLGVHGAGASDIGGILDERHTDVAGFGGHLLLARSRGTEGSKSVVQDNDVVSRINMLAYDGTDYAQLGEFRAEIDGTPGAGDMPGRLIFLTTPASSETPLERMRIANDGTTTLLSTDAGAAAAPNLILHRNSASPAANDVIGLLKFDGEDSGSTQTTYASVQGVLLDPTDTTEEAHLDFYVMESGTLTKVMSLGGLVDQHGVDIFGDLEITHTSTHDDDHGMELTLNAAGFGGVAGFEINYITGALAAVDSDAAILINIDETATSAGTMVGLEVLATAGAATNWALLAGATVGPVQQFAGVFANPTAASEEGNDILAAISSGGAGNVAIFNADNEVVIIEDSVIFEEMSWQMDTGASGAGIAPTFEYSTGSGTWATFAPEDGTDGMRQTGVIAWSDASVPGFVVGATGNFMVRITRTRNSLTTTPIVDTIQTSNDTEFSWDKDGDILVRQIKTTQTGDIEGAAILGSTVDVEGVATFASTPVFASEVDAEANLTVVGTITAEGSAIAAAETTDEFVMTFNAGTETWEGQAGSTVGGIDDLTDVETSVEAPADDEVLTWDDAAEQWHPQPSGSVDWTYLAEVTLAAAESDELMVGVDMAGVTEIQVLLNNVTTEATTDDLIVQLGPSSGPVTTGYESSATNQSGSGTSESGAISNGIPFYHTRPAVGDDHDSVMHLTRWDPDQHFWSGTVSGSSGANAFTHGAGSITLAGELTDIDLFINGLNFDGGTARVRYRKPFAVTDVPLNNLSDVSVTAPADKAIVMWDDAAEAWQDKTVSDSWTYTTQTATTSGQSVAVVTEVAMTGVTEIEVYFNDVSMDATGEVCVRIGPATGVVSTGYLGRGGSIGASSAASAARTDGFHVSSGGVAASTLLHGVMNLKRWDASEHLWAMNTMLGDATMWFGNSSITLAGELADITLTTTEGDVEFDNGEIRARYR